MDKRLLDEDEIMQLCFVTDDLEKSAKWFSELTGKPIPPEGKAAEPGEAQAVYNGRPAAVGCRIIMFKFGNIDFEFLQPGPEKSAWRDILEQKGPGFHHFAFRTRRSRMPHHIDMAVGIRRNRRPAIEEFGVPRKIALLRGEGIPLRQTGIEQG